MDLVPQHAPTVVSMPLVEAAVVSEPQNAATVISAPASVPQQASTSPLASSDFACVAIPLHASPSAEAASSASDSFPPGFAIKHSAVENVEIIVPATSLDDIGVDSSPVLVGSELEVMSSIAPDESQEEGEFTPVLNKKTLKRLKHSAKALSKPNPRAPARALLLKSAKHKRFL